MVEFHYWILLRLLTLELQFLPLAFHLLLQMFKIILIYGKEIQRYTTTPTMLVNQHSSVLHGTKKWICFTCICKHAAKMKFPALQMW